MTLRYLFVDMNSYFASVEQQSRPELRGRPVAVLPVVADTTCCIAASYEAKRHGVKTGTLVRDARRMCPGLICVEARPELYIRTHHQILAAIDTATPIQAVLSIDEVVCRLSGKECEPAGAVRLGEQIKAAIYSRVGAHLRCSVGIAPNHTLAKLASDMQKPDGLTVIQTHELPQRLHGLTLRDFPGIGSRMEARLRRAGVQTVEQLCQLPKSDLARIWQSPLLGGMWWERLRGGDVVEPPTHRHSVGHSHVLPPEARQDRPARAVVMRLVHRAAARLRHLGYHAQLLTMNVGFQGAAHGWAGAKKVLPTDDTLAFLQAARDLWEDKPRVPPGILKVGITLCDLVPRAQSPLFLYEADRKRSELAHAMDEINRRLGNNAVYFGGMHEAKGQAPLRIAFTRIPELDIPDA